MAGWVDKEESVPAEENKNGVTPAAILVSGTNRVQL